MATSQNGWPVDKSGAKQDRKALVRDVTVPNGVLAGDVAVVFRWLAGRYETLVERLVKGTCWGWYVKQIEGSAATSNHASGTAVDFNADRHPMGAQPSGSFSSGQIKACRAIVAEAGGVLRWGGDYTGRKDAMHWEINTTAARVKAFADKIRAGVAPGQEDDVTPADITAIGKEVVLRLTTGAAQEDGTPNSPVGHAVLVQGIPNGMKQDAPRDYAYVILRDIGESLARIEKLLTEPTPPE
jgi:hypothetical protein